MRTIGMDPGVTAASEGAVAKGAHLESVRKVASTPAGLVAALRKAAAGGAVHIVLESTAMAWFVAGVAAVRAAVDHTLFRVSGTKAVALPALYRTHTKTDRIDAGVLDRMPQVDEALRVFTLPSAGGLALKRLVVLRHKLVAETVRLQGRIRSTRHWAAPTMLGGQQAVTDGFVAILARWPDLRDLARVRVATIARVGRSPRSGPSAAGRLHGRRWASLRGSWTFRRPGRGAGGRGGPPSQPEGPGCPPGDPHSPAAPPPAPR